MPIRGGLAGGGEFDFPTELGSIYQRLGLGAEPWEAGRDVNELIWTGNLQQGFKGFGIRPEYLQVAGSKNVYYLDPATGQLRLTSGFTPGAATQVSDMAALSTLGPLGEPVTQPLVAPLDPYGFSASPLEIGGYVTPRIEALAGIWNEIDPLTREYLTREMAERYGQGLGGTQSERMRAATESLERRRRFYSPAGTGGGLAALG